MSELSKRLRVGYTCADDDTDHCHHIDSCGHDDEVLELCDKYERLEAEHARICNEHALLVQESGREGRELDRLEGLLRAWGLEFDIRRRDAVYAEAVRLAKESE